MKKIETLIICHLIFNKKEMWTKVILKLFIAIVVWAFNNLGLKIYSLWGSRVPLNIPHLKNFAATINVYTHPINVPGIFSCHMHISDLSHFLGQATSKTSSFLETWLQDYKGGGPKVVVSTAAFHARVRGSVPGFGGLKETKLFLPHPRVKVSIVGSLRDREVACSASDRQGSNFESCVWRTVSSQSSHHPQEVLLAQFSLYVHKGGLKPESFHFPDYKVRVGWGVS